MRWRVKPKERFNLWDIRVIKRFAWWPFHDEESCVMVWLEKGYVFQMYHGEERGGWCDITYDRFEIEKSLGRTVVRDDRKRSVNVLFD